MNTLAHFRRLFEYEADCSAKVLDSLRAGQAHLESSGIAAEAAPFIRAVEIFAHIQAARCLWLSRLDPSVRPPSDGLFPSVSLEKAAAQSRDMDAAWLSYARRISDPDLDRVFTYKTTEGLDRAFPIRDILTHLVNHSSYHRGQIARLVAECGAKAAITDYIFFVHEHPESDPGL
jgi:uncharacterized damage-inducible protein DinB